MYLNASGIFVTIPVHVISWIESIGGGRVEGVGELKAD